MNHPVAIKSALLSAFYKDNLEPVIKQLDALGITIYSTGGTAKFIEESGIKTETIEELTAYPSILGGRVKTLHPKVFGAILGRRAKEADVAQMQQYTIPAIDLVVVNLYPFAETIKSTSHEEEIIEKIDIGGVALIRAAAKNFHDVLVIASKNDYDFLLGILKNQKGISSVEQRKTMAKKAFEIIAEYDAAIFNYFDKENTAKKFSVSSAPEYPLRYGENPHQTAAFFGAPDAIFEKLHGRDLSYNNLIDIESAVYLMEEFPKNAGCTLAILKHTNACGLATAATAEEAWDKALAADPVSAYGGVIICNTAINAAVAKKINEIFFEVLIAPYFDADAYEILASKKNRILLKQKQFAFPAKQFKSLLNGILVQDRNTQSSVENQLQFVTKKISSSNEIKDLLFAEKAVKHLKSNGIALVKNLQLTGSASGQTSRVDALKQAIEKANRFGFNLHGAVMASEAFFPFPDCVEIAHEEGITAIIQPGGSVKDKDSIAYCDAHNIAMVFSGIRHFKH